jgi:hypothetical protein
MNAKHGGWTARFDERADVAKIRARIAELEAENALIKTEAAKAAMRLVATNNELRDALSTVREQMRALEDVLEFYADPDTYFAIGFFPDEPAGEFMNDFEDLGIEFGYKPGKRARAALPDTPQQPSVREGERE